MLSVADAARLGVAAGDEIEVAAGRGSLSASASCAPASPPAASSCRGTGPAPTGPVEIRTREAVAGLMDEGLESTFVLISSRS